MTPQRRALSPIRLTPVDDAGPAALPDLPVPTGPDSPSAHERRRGPSRPTRPPRPSLILWRARHLVAAVCVAGATLLILGILRPPPPSSSEVLVAARPVAAGEVLTESDLERRSIPEAAVPDQGLADESVIGARSAIALEPRTVVTTSMTSASLAADLSPTERIVQVPVAIGAELATAGSRVDIVTQGAPDQGTQAAPTVVCSGARVLLRDQHEESGQWVSGTKVTLVTLAVPEGRASLVVGAATFGTLAIVLSP